MYCRNCGKEVAEKAEICISCGVKPMAGTKYCHNCAAEVNEKAEICIKCGVSFKKHATHGPDTWAWIAAFLPLFYIPVPFIFILGCILINCIALSIDARELRKAGYDTSPLGSPILVPVYLYRRPRVVGSYIYFILWMVFFVIGIFV
jgi:hypothetical protein